jgi:hypothetical protein
MTRILRIVLLCEVMTLACNASAQSIADLARQERDRKKAIANKTYTNADVAPAAVTGTTAVTTAGTASTSTTAPDTVTAKSTGPTDIKVRDEKYWLEQFATAREELKNAEAQIRILEARIGISNLQMAGQSDLYDREGRLQADIAATNTQIAAAREEANKARQKIAALEEELRRSGGPAGWAR